MGMRAHASLCFGILLDPCMDYPWVTWGEEKGFGGPISSIEAWWNYVGSGWDRWGEVYDKNGNIFDHVSMDGQYAQWCEEHTTYMGAHPLPVRLVQHGSEEYPQYILASPSSVLETNWDSPLSLGGQLPLIIDLMEFVGFCSRFHIETLNKIGWHLSTFWG